MSTISLRHRHGSAPDHVFRGRHHGGPILARGMVALSLPLLLRWAVAAGQEDLVEVLPREVSGLTVTVAEVFRDMAAVSATAQRTSNQLSVTRKLRHVRASMQSNAQIVVEAEVADATCAGHLAVTAATMLRNKQLSSVAMSSHVPRRCRQATGPRETVPGVCRRTTGLRHLLSVRSPSRAVPTVRSTADFRPDLDWDAGRTTDFDGHY